MTELKKSGEILTKMIDLAAPHDLPKDFTDNCKRIWEAFNVGRDYEQELQKEEKCS